jgi:hypothetical protein
LFGPNTSRAMNRITSKCIGCISPSNIERLQTSSTACAFCASVDTG